MFVYECMCVTCVSVSMYVCVYVSMCVFEYVSIYVFVSM